MAAPVEPRPRRRRKSDPLPLPEFSRLALRFAVFAFGFLFTALGIGILGYHQFVDLDWIDSLLNASMILTGMGPVSPMPDDEAKIFASVYAIFSGIVYPGFAAIILYPFLHHALAIFHLQTLEGQPGSED